MGVALSKTQDGKWEVGTCQTSGGGFYAGYGGRPEGHAIPTIATVQIKGSGESLKKAWKSGVDSGMLDDMPKEVIKMIKKHFKQVYLGVDQQKIQAPVNKE